MPSRGVVGWTVSRVWAAARPQPLGGLVLVLWTKLIAGHVPGSAGYLSGIACARFKFASFVLSRQRNRANVQHTLTRGYTSTLALPTTASPRLTVHRRSLSVSSRSRHRLDSALYFPSTSLPVLPPQSKDFGPVAIGYCPFCLFFL